MSKVAVISAILKEPAKNQKAFNDIVSAFQEIVRGRMGIPFDKENIAVISLTVYAELDSINELTTQLANVDGVTANCVVS